MSESTFESPAVGSLWTPLYARPAYRNEKGEFCNANAVISELFMIVSIPIELSKELIIIKVLTQSGKIRYINNLWWNEMYCGDIMLVSMP